MRHRRDRTDESALTVIVTITAIVYFLYYYLQIHTVVTQDPRDCLYETWQLVTEPRIPAPLDAFTLVVILLVTWLLADFLSLFKSQGFAKRHQVICYAAVLGCLGYWGFSIYKFNEFFSVEKQEISRNEYLTPENRERSISPAYVRRVNGAGDNLSAPFEDVLSDLVCGQGIDPWLETYFLLPGTPKSRIRTSL